MSSSLGKFTRLRELVEDWERIVAQYPQVGRLQVHADRARMALEAVRDALAPAVVQEVGRDLQPINHAAEEHRKLANVRTIIDGYFAS